MRTETYFYLHFLLAFLNLVIYATLINSAHSAMEIGTIAHQCPETSNLHIQSEGVLVEVLDDHAHVDAGIGRSDRGRNLERSARDVVEFGHEIRRRGWGCHRDQVAVEIACLTDLSVGPVGIIAVQIHIQQIAPVTVADLQARLAARAVAPEQARQIIAGWQQAEAEGKGVVVVDIDTLLVPDLSTLDILTFTEPDNIFMGSQVTEYLCKKIGYKGNVVHTQGQLTHTGAQGRAKGFRQTVSKYPDIKVIDETPGEWSVDKTRQIWDSLLVKHGQIDGGFFHNDDMALGAYAALQAVDRDKDTVLCGVDAMAPALRALKKGQIQGTVFNPACRVHGYAFWAAWFHLANKVKKADIPSFIRCDGPVVTVDSKPEEIDSYIWCNEHFLI